MGKKKAKKQVIGHRYYMGAHMVFCHGPADQLLELKLGDRQFWAGASSGGRLTISQADLYGGERREGGISGELDVLMGGDAQTANDYLQAKMAAGGVTPAFRGVVSLVLRKMYLAANAAVIKPISARIKRIDSGWDSAAEGFGPTTAGDGMNAAAIIYQCLTDRRWGMGWPASGVDLYSFQLAGYQLQNENFGLNLLFDRQRPVEDFIQTVLDHISGVLRMDAQGRFQMKLVRDDIGGPTPRAFGPYNVADLESFERPTWDETVNELTVRYTDAATWQQKTVTVHNLANIQTQGGVVSETRDYPGITDDALASKVALRDLASVSVPLARVNLRVDTRPEVYLQSGGHYLHKRGDLPLPGDRVSFSWPDLGIDNMLLRVGAVEVADVDDHSLRLLCVEDVFGMRSVVLTTQNTAQWAAPNTTPANPIYSVAIEAAWWDVALNTGPGDLAQLDALDTWITCHAVRANQAQVSWRYLTGADLASAQERGDAGYAPLGYLAASLAAGTADVVLSLNSTTDLAAFARCEYAWIIDSAGNLLEAVGVVSVDSVAGSVTISRGVLDTMPVAASAGARLIGVTQDAGVDPVIRAAGETIKSWIKPVTGSQAGSAVAPTHNASLVLSGRPGRPYPPAGVKFNAVAYPVVVAGDLAITWARRNRLSQTASLIRQTDGDILPEVNQTTTVRIRNSSGALVRTYSGIAGTGQTWDAATAAADAGALGGTVTVEIEAERDSLASWKKHSITLQRAGWGLRYGQYYGGV